MESGTDGKDTDFVASDRIDPTAALSDSPESENPELHQAPIEVKPPLTEEQIVELGDRRNKGLTAEEVRQINIARQNGKHIGPF